MENALRERDPRAARPRLVIRSLAEWAGIENLEERVDGEEIIDPVVLGVLRERTA